MCGARLLSAMPLAQTMAPAKVTRRQSKRWHRALATGATTRAKDVILKGINIHICLKVVFYEILK
jgi:hypothetical protein